MDNIFLSNGLIINGTYETKYIVENNLLLIIILEISNFNVFLKLVDVILVTTRHLLIGNYDDTTADF